MSKQYGWFYRQKITGLELAAGFDALIASDEAIANDFGYGVAAGAGVAAAGTPNLTVLVAAGVAYDKTGKRAAWTAQQVVDVSKDSSNVSTSVAGSGKSKIISVFAKYKRALTVPRIDGNGDTKYFDQADSFDFVVVQGAEAVSPTAPALDATYVLLADITRAFGQTTITTGDISTARREHYAPQRFGSKFNFTQPTVGGQLGEAFAALDTNGQPNGFVPLNGSSKIPAQYLPPLLVLDEQVYDHRVAQDTGMNTSAPLTGNVGSTSGAWTDLSGPTVTVASCAFGERVVVFASALTDLSFLSGTYREVRMTVSEAGGSDVEVPGSRRTCNTSSVCTESLIWAFQHTVLAAGNVVVKMQYRTDGNGLAFDKATILGLRVPPALP